MARLPPISIPGLWSSPGTLLFPYLESAPLPWSRVRLVQRWGTWGDNNSSKMDSQSRSTKAGLLWIKGRELWSMKPGHKIHQNPSIESCSQIEFTAQNIQRRYKYQRRYKRRHEYTNLNEKESDYNHDCSFWKRNFSLIVYQSSFLLFDVWCNAFVTFDVMLL